MKRSICRQTISDDSLSNNVVRQFISIVVHVWKTMGENFADLFDHSHYLPGVIAFPKSGGEVIRQMVPKTLFAVLVEALVTYNGKLSRVRRDENKRGIALAGLMHLQRHKGLPRFGHRILDPAVGHEDPDFTA